MFFNDTGEIKDIATKNGTSVFVLPCEIEFSIKNAIVLQPEEKSLISIEQIRELTSRLNLKQPGDQFVIIRPADKMSIEAANAFLKNLEEPVDNLHFILITDAPSRLLPTILSRAAVYFLRQNWSERDDIAANSEIKDLAKQLISSSGAQLVKIMNKITTTKKNKKEFALSVVEASIEILYKSYFITNKQVFVNKLPKFLQLYDNLSKNGNPKLHIVADLC